MPVRITSDPNDPAELAITADYLQEGKDNFREHYYLDNGSSDFIADFKLNWDDLQTAVNDYMVQYPEVPEAEIAMRFIHCYDPNDTTLYLRLLICQMNMTTITDFDRPVCQLLDNTYQSYYELRSNAVTPLDPCALYDQVYLDSFIYKPISTEALQEDLSEDGGLKFVRTLTFPWKDEILAMYNQNIPQMDPPPTVVWIHFASCSYTAYNPGDDAVMWPHGLVMYLQADSDILLDDENYISIFRCKGCDLGTMCPPKCGSYLCPPMTEEAPRY